MEWRATPFGGEPVLYVNDPLSYYTQPIPFAQIARIWQKRYRSVLACIIIQCAVTRCYSSAGANPARQLSLQPVAVGADDGGNDIG